MPISTTRPDCMTTTRWAISATTPKSWVMNRTPVPRRSCSSRISLQDLRLRRHVERGGGLVGDQQRGIEHEGGGDHDALALAARDLVRIDVDQALGLGQVHGAHDLQHALAPVGLGKLGVDLQHLGDLVADGHDRVERRHRLLEDHGHARAAQVAQARAAWPSARSRPRAGSRRRWLRARAAAGPSPPGP